MSKYIEEYRKQAVENLFNMDSFNTSFAQWRIEFQQHLKNNNYSHKALQEISKNLRGIFQGTAQAGRDQSSVSSGGAAWEGLVCWYLNLCLIGSNCVVVKQNKKLIPDPIRKSLTVMYGTKPSNTESDLIAITFPKSVNQDIKSDSDINEYCSSHFSDLEVCVIQCKTNWNDNAQIPMLWDIIYNSAGSIKVASVGIEGYSVDSLKRFSYAFVTVPSQKDIDIFKPKSTAIMRVERLSGGNYWGEATKVGVALSLNEMLTKNFNTAISGLGSGWHSHIDQELKELNNNYKYFGLS